MANKKARKQQKSNSQSALPAHPLAIKEDELGACFLCSGFSFFGTTVRRIQFSGIEIPCSNAGKKIIARTDITTSDECQYKCKSKT